MGNCHLSLTPCLCHSFIACSQSLCTSSCTTLLYSLVVPPLHQNLGDLFEYSIVLHGCSQLLLDVVLALHIKQEYRLHYRPKLSMFCHIFIPQIQVHISKPAGVRYGCLVGSRHRSETGLKQSKPVSKR